MQEKWRRFRFSLKFAVNQMFKEHKLILVVKVFLIGLFIGFIASLWSLNRETTEGPQRYLKTLNVDYWVTQAGADSMSSSSYVSPALHDQLRDAGYNVDGTLVYFNKVNNRNVTYQAYESGSPLDPLLAEGRQVAGDHEVVLDHIMADKLNVGIGDTVRMVNDDFTVVGLSNETNSVAKEVAFINHNALTRLVGNRTFQVLAIRLEAGQTWPPNNIDFTGYTTVTNEQFLQSNEDYQTETYTPFFTIPIVIAIIGLTSFLAFVLVLEYFFRLRRFALLKAVGASSGFLAGVELVMMVVIIAIGMAFSALIANVVVFFANDSIPGTTASVTFDDLLVGLTIIVVISLIALVSPIWRVSRLSPVTVLREG